MSLAQPSRPPELDSGAPREIEVRYYAELLWRRRVLLAATALGGLVLGVLAGELQQPRYQARTLLQVTMEDAAAADEIFRVLMGDHVEPRREFIEKHALDVRDLDV